MIQIVGPKDKANFSVIDITSKASGWSKGLSPFILGPVYLWGDYKSRTMENAWQFSKVYEQHTGKLGLPTEDWIKWATEGWQLPRGVRYPFGKEVEPLYFYYQDQKLNLVAARKKIYIPLYAQAAKKSEDFSRLERAYFDKDSQISLFDFDGYDYQSLGMTLEDVVQDVSRPMSSAFVLAMLLENKL